jgi:hypothetical protein
MFLILFLILKIFLILIPMANFQSSSVLTESMSERLCPTCRSLPRLSMREDTTEKLSRVLMKFDSMDHTDDMHEDVKAHLEKEAAAAAKKNK